MRCRCSGQQAVVHKPGSQPYHRVFRHTHKAMATRIQVRGSTVHQFAQSTPHTSIPLSWPSQLEGFRASCCSSVDHAAGIGLVSSRSLPLHIVDKRQRGSSKHGPCFCMDLLLLRCSVCPCNIFPLPLQNLPPFISIQSTAFAAIEPVLLTMAVRWTCICSLTSPGLLRPRPRNREEVGLDA